MNKFKEIEAKFNNFWAKRYVKLILSSILASIGVCLAAYTYLTTTVRAHGDYKLFGGVFFCVGFFLICYLNWHLFTGKIGCAISSKSWRYILDITIIFSINVLFCMLIGLFMKLTFNPLLEFHGVEGMRKILQDSHAYSALASENGTINDMIEKTIQTALWAQDKTHSIIADKVAKGWLLIPSGFFCGFSIHVVVVIWRKYTSVGIRAISLIFAIAAFVLSGFDHFLANTFILTLGSDISYAKQIGIGKLTLVVVYTVIGNALGAMFIEHSTNYMDQQKKVCNFEPETAVLEQDPNALSNIQ